MTALDYIRYYERVTRIDPTCDYAGRSRKIDDIIAEAQKKAYGMVLYALSDTEEDLLKRFYNKKNGKMRLRKVSISYTLLNQVIVPVVLQINFWIAAILISEK